MPFTQLMDKSLLDWVTGAANPTRPSGLWFAYATTSPTTASAFDGPFTRVTVTVGAAHSPPATVSNNNSIVGLATAAATPVGWNLYDSSAGGNRLAYGTLTATIGCKSADTAFLDPGSLTITLS